MGDLGPLDVAGLEPVGQTVLCTDLQPDTSADLDVVSRAALALAVALRELALMLDPSTAVRAELVGGGQSDRCLPEAERNRRGARPPSVAGVGPLMAAFSGLTEVGRQRTAERHGGADIRGDGEGEHGATLRSFGRDRFGVLSTALRFLNH